MSARSIFILILTGLWFWFCHYWYCCWMSAACYGCGQQIEAAASPPTTATTDKGPLLFKWTGANPITNDKFTAYKNRILSGKSDDNILEIVGHYFKDEKNTSKFENMGIARANQIRELFAKDIPIERIRLRGTLVDPPSGAKDDLFPAAEFNWVKTEIEKSEVIELPDRAIILFPFNSSQKERDANVDSYLKKLAERVKQTNEKIMLTGHTDDVGEERNNYKLGMNRAKGIKNILVQFGVKSATIKTDSKGETMPVASNATDEGKHQNRRVEVKLIKQ